MKVQSSEALTEMENTFRKSPTTNTVNQVIGVSLPSGSQRLLRAPDCKYGESSDSHKRLSFIFIFLEELLMNLIKYYIKICLALLSPPSHPVKQ